MSPLCNFFCRVIELAFGRASPKKLEIRKTKWNPFRSLVEEDLILLQCSVNLRSYLRKYLVKVHCCLRYIVTIVMVKNSSILLLILLFLSHYGYPANLYNSYTTVKGGPGTIVRAHTSSTCTALYVEQVTWPLVPRTSPLNLDPNG